MSFVREQSCCPLWVRKSFLGMAINTVPLKGYHNLRIDLPPDNDPANTAPYLQLTGLEDGMTITDLPSHSTQANYKLTSLVVGPARQDNLH